MEPVSRVFGFRVLLTLFVPILLILLILGACGSTPASSQSSPSALASASPSPLACTSGGPASTSWPPAGYLSASSVPPPPLVSAVVSGDTLTLTFQQGTPLFEVTTQPNAHFTETTGRGAPVDLAGSAGVLIILRGFRGDMKNYMGTTDFNSNGQFLLQARNIGEFEGVMGWAAGLSKPGCANVTVSSSALTFRFIAAAPG